MYHSVLTHVAEFCCGAIEIGNFGGGEEWSDEEDEEDFDELLHNVKGILRSAKRTGNSLVYATTMSNQPKAAKVLSQLGFYTSKPFNTVGGDKRKMQAWFLPLTEHKG